MYKHLIGWVAILLWVSILWSPHTVSAYSYGDPTMEDVAETYKTIDLRLSSSPPDWQGAFDAYKVRRAEISSHFGEPIAVTLDHNFQAENKELLIQNYKYVLYINLDRRFNYAKKDIDDYSKSKLLLAKAKGTFDVIKPYVKSQLPQKEIEDLETAFEKALEALGNPGLFGMGKKPVKPEVLEEQTKYILETLKPLFSYTAFEAEPQTNETNPPEEPAVSTDENTDSQPEQDEQTVEKNTDSNTESPEPKEEASSESIDEPKQVSTENNDQPIKQAEKPATNKQDEEEESSIEKPENDQPVIDETQGEIQEEIEEEIEGETEIVEETVPPSVTDTEKEIALSPIDEHDPMAREDRTNPFVTLVIIMGVLVLGGGSIWYAKKKNFI